MVTKTPIILCVDDELNNLDLLEAMLNPRGFETVLVESGEKALEVIDRTPVDVILLDVMMSGISGYEVCRRVKNDPKHRTIPIILLTTLTSVQDRIQGIEAGAEDFISKPFELGEVLARVKMLLEVKSLNDRLNNAYTDMAGLASFGEATIRTFDPLSFDYMSKIDSTVKRIIRTKKERPTGPEVVLVGFVTGFADNFHTSTTCGIVEGLPWRWFFYAESDGHVKRRELDLKIQCGLNLPQREEARTVFCNKVDRGDSEFARITDMLRTALGKTSRPGADSSSPTGIFSISNFVCYSSHNFCVFALNFERDVTEYDASVLNVFVVQALFLKSIAAQVREVEDAFEYTVLALARAAEANDEDTGNHIVRVGKYAALLAEKLGMRGAFVDAIRIQGQMHDVGKIHIPPEILKKPGKLTPVEWEEIKNHTLYGAKILGDHTRLAMARSIALTHHERWDGSGYPEGLKDERIPIEGRILSIADQYDALRNPRVYKPAFDHEHTVRIITEGDGRTMPHHFDPQVLRVFKETASQFQQIYEELKDERDATAPYPLC